MTKEELEERRETCKVRNKLGYCNVPDKPFCGKFYFESNLDTK